MNSGLLTIDDFPSKNTPAIVGYLKEKNIKSSICPKNKPEIVTVAKANYIAVRGKGNPNEEGGAYQQTISVLYAVAYTLTLKNAARERSLQ